MPCSRRFSFAAVVRSSASWPHRRPLCRPAPRAPVRYLRLRRPVQGRLSRMTTHAAASLLQRLRLPTVPDGLVVGPSQTSGSKTTAVLAGAGELAAM